MQNTLYASNSWNPTLQVELVVVADGFNQLDVAEVSDRNGLLPLVSQKAKGRNVLIMIMTSAL